MKQILQTLALAGLLSLSLLGCASGGDSTPAATPDAGQTTESPGEDSQAQGETADEAGETAGDQEPLRVGMDLGFPPFSYLGDDGQAAGFEPVVAEAFAAYLGREVEIVNASFSMLISELELGTVDILIADMAATPERAEKVDFSDPYRYTNTLALVNKDFAQANNVSDDMAEEDFFALEGARFVGLAGTKGVYYPENLGIDVTGVTEIGTGLVEVSSGLADILVASNEVHGFHAADPENTVVYGGILAQDASNFAVRKGDTELLAQANAFIATLYDDDGLYAQIAPEFDPIVGEFLKNLDLGLDYITVPRS